VLHRAAYEELRLGDWSYDRFEVDEEALPGFSGSSGRSGRACR
jgi:shikimate dehydrogenase